MQDNSKSVPEALRSFFVEHPRIALAFSGGVDSSYLLCAAKACGADVRAYYAHAQFQPDFEYQDALRLAEEVGIPVTVLELDVLQNEAVAKNPADRCYHCKQALFAQIVARAGADGYTELMDGTNASDDADDRPGMRALAELHVFSPLRLCGITKAEVREYSKQAGLFTWNKPAYACLATRIPTGTRIELEMLQKIEQAENELFALGFSDFRVRWREGRAVLQLPEAQFERLLACREDIIKALGLLFAEVLLDLRPRQGE